MEVEQPKPFRIIIVGGGIAGLAVAHGLERAQKEGRVRPLSIEVVEKWTEDSDFQKYPLRISPEGREALNALLSPPELANLISLSNHGITHGGVTMFTETLSPLFSVKRYEDEQPQFIHRGVLRQVLAEGVDLRRGKRVVRVRDDRPEGNERVNVVYDDGTEDSADLFIGAEGVGSNLRTQLHPSHTRVPTLPYIVIQFKILGSSSTLCGLDTTGVNLILGKKSYSVILAPLSGTPVPPLSPTNVNPFTDPADAASTLSALDEPCPEYIFCAVALPDFPQWEDMTGPAWLGKIAKLLKDDGADPALVRAILEDSVPQTVGAWQIVSMNEDDPVPWNGGSVVLIGDAVHAMAPQGGVGGSIALKDAQHLVDTVVSATELGGAAGPIDSLLPIFHKEMMNRAAGHMRDARRRLHLSHKEGWAVYWQRGLLRLMGFFWPLANWILNRGRDSAKKAGIAPASDKKRV